MVKKIEAQEDSLFNLVTDAEIEERFRAAARERHKEVEADLNRTTTCAGCWNKFIRTSDMDEFDECIPDGTGRWFHPWCAPTETTYG